MALHNKSGSPLLFIRNLWPILIISLTLWAILPGLYFGNLHTDTLEIIYWGHDPAWGYSKHPPLITWILSTIIQPGSVSILTITAYGQLAAALSAYFIYSSVVRVADRPTAVLAACMMMLTSTATFYSVQVNHNSAIIPFCAAILYFGLRYLEERRVRDALGFGMAAGLGALTKYEIVFALVPIAVLCFAIPRHRSAFFSWGTAIAILIASVLVFPHILWQSEHSWVSFERATSSAPLDDFWAILLGLYDVAVGLITILSGPIILLLTLRHWRLKANNTDHPSADQRKVGLILFVAPILSVVLAGAATNQIIKVLWMLPLTPSLIAALAILFPFERDRTPITGPMIVTSSIKVSAGIFFLYLLYLFIGEVIDLPAESYLANTRALSAEAEKLWLSNSASPLKCVVTDEGKLAPSAVLWMKSRPQILPIYAADWANPQRLADCNETGGVAIKFEIDEPFNVEKKFPNACIKDEIAMHVDTVSGLSKTGWNAKLVYIPPMAQPNCAK
jgi:4-amino-4-deoxy-L-arabinose transferase-like glycosyltransferase